MIAIDALWPALLECRRSLRAAEDLSDGAWVFSRDAAGVWRFQWEPATQGWYLTHDTLRCDLRTPLPEPVSEALGMSSVYLQLLLDQHAVLRDRVRSHVTVSFAQTLDGYIATTAGLSKWIGNHSNLVHAHRLRALHDAILVGATTARIDRPMLSVRHVDGDDPQRVIISRDRSLPLGDLVMQCTRSTLVLMPESLCAKAQSANATLRLCPVETSCADAMLSPDRVLATLRQRSIHSLMIEGGGTTISGFYAAGLVDNLQVHVAPMWFGDGVRPIQVPTQTAVGSNPDFETTTYGLDSQVLLSMRRRSRCDDSL
ncbi:MAG: dihydrofolate reductase family protein [Pseudomonadota bacterium]